MGHEPAYRFKLVRSGEQDYYYLIDLARELGKFNGSVEDDYWNAELQAVYKQWRTWLGRRPSDAA